MGVLLDIFCAVLLFLFRAFLWICFIWGVIRFLKLLFVDSLKHRGGRWFAARIRLVVFFFISKEKC